MTAFFNLIGGVKGIIIGLIIAAALGWVFVQKRAVTKAEEARDIAIAQQQQIKGELDKALSANKENQDTIRKLQEEKDNIQLALNQRDADLQKIRNRVNKTDKTIDSQAGLPENKAPLSPVLKSVLQELEAERALKRQQGR